jgi:hypothetical protein
MSYKKILSIHGAPRSGTSWLGQLFNSSPQVRFKFQPFYSYAFRDQLNVDDDAQKTRDFFDALYDSNEEYLDRQVQIKDGIYPEFKIKQDSPEFLSLKSVKYHYYIPKFLRELDDFNLIAIIRNPKAVMNSFLNAPKEFDQSLNRLDEWRFAQTRNDFRPEYYYGFHRWVESNTLFLDMKRKYPNRVYIINYQSLANNPKDQLEKCFDFCSINMSDQTYDFIEKSTSAFQEDVYSVYRGNRDLNAWQNTLEPEIQQAIDRDIKGTALEAFYE